MPNDFQLDCTWEDVENSAKQPNVFVTMSEYHDPDIGDITVADKSGAAIFGLLQSNPKQQIVFTDLSGRQCIMTTPPTSGVSEVRFSVLVGTTLYIYRMPDGNARVYTDTVDISSGDSGTFVVRFTVANQVISADQTYADVMTAAANGKVVLGRYGSNHYYFTGDPDDDGATFVRPFFNNNAQSLQQIILADDESVTISTRQLASNAVLYTQQTLTNQQKAQARANIGATDGASGISDTIKQELLNCFAHVAWADEQGQDYYDALEAALYTKTLESISAVFDQGSAVIYPTDTLDILRQYLTVTATYDDTSTAVVTAYTLSGTLTAGTSTITAAYGGKTATFNVTVTAWNPYLFSLENGQITKVTGATSGNESGHAHEITYNNGTYANRRRSYPTLREGVEPYKDSNDNWSDTIYYPIPIPADAIKAKISITPTTQYHGESMYTYEPGTGYTRQADPGWKQGSFTHTFTAGAYDYITVVSKYDSSGTTYPTEPTALVVEFLTE